MVQTGDTVIVQRAGENAGIAKLHPHAFRHGAGFALRNQGHDILTIAAHLGHKSIQNAYRYAGISPERRAEIRVR